MSSLARNPSPSVENLLLKKPDPILVSDLFPEILGELLALLKSLSDGEWNRPTSCSLWSVKDIGLHLLGGDVGILSRRRDHCTPAGGAIQSWSELVALINSLNDLWVKATRRMSTRLLCDLLRFTGEQVCEYFKSLDPHAVGDPVDWAGPGPAPVWLDLAREYTERWHHQQQIRDAVGKPGLKEPRFFAPVLDAFVRALPHTYRDVRAEEGTVVSLVITGESGGKWFLLRENGKWNLYLDAAREPAAGVVLDQETAWKLFTKGISKEQARAHAKILGDQKLAAEALAMVSVIA
jgi:uncharacterized protein (TIGR03083 family)